MMWLFFCILSGLLKGTEMYKNYLIFLDADDADDADFYVHVQ